AGIPQSASGQATILTGVNGAKYLGNHLRGFPNKKLRELIKRENIYGKLSTLGLTGTFANVYRPDFFSKYISQEKYHSVTTTAALANRFSLRTIEDLLQGNGVYQDITNHLLIKQGVDVSLVEPVEAGHRIGTISGHYDFTLFEYFQSDLAGHQQDYPKIQSILSTLDSLIAGIINSIDLTNTVVIITSDHGNIEDISHNHHTENPVPTLIISEAEEAHAIPVFSLEDITPLILELVQIRRNRK
ncbi:MAG: alkaline phosphatase family protein, partial [Bacillota bacterium]|nr:alkaline phosphatase family protein [Bacillota bacterium]